MHANISTVHSKASCNACEKFKYYSYFVVLPDNDHIKVIFTLLRMVKRVIHPICGVGVKVPISTYTTSWLRDHSESITGR